MHQYLDSDSSGKSADCVSAQIGVQRIVGATAWLRANGKKGFLGEFAGGANSVCQQAVTGLLDHLVANSDVWTGGTFSLQCSIHISKSIKLINRSYLVGRRSVVGRLYLLFCSLFVDLRFLEPHPEEVRSVRDGNRG